MKPPRQGELHKTHPDGHFLYWVGGTPTDRFEIKVSSSEYATEVIRFWKERE